MTTRFKDLHLLRQRAVRCVLIWVVLPGLPIIGLAQPSSESKKVLVLYWYHKDYPWNSMFDQGFRKELQVAQPGIEYHAEYLETNRFPENEESELMHEYLLKKYSGHHIDVLVATSDVSLAFLMKYRAELFPNSPVVFVATKVPEAESLKNSPGITGIISINAYRKTLDLALQLHPDTRTVFIVSGTPENDKRIETLARQDLGNEQRVAVNYLTDVPPDQLVATIKNLPKSSLIMYVWQQWRAPDGKLVESMDILDSLAHSATVPLYRLSTTTYEGGGVVGGYLNKAEANGTKVAELVQKITAGTPAENIPVESAATVLEFDWRELQRWGISESQLPPGSVIRFKDVTFWNQYEDRIIVVLAIITLQALLIAALLFQRRRRWQATRQLAESQREFSTLVENSPDIICRLNCDLKYIYISPGFERITRLASATFIGKTPREIALPGYDWETFQHTCRTAITSRNQVERSFDYNDRTYWTRIIPEVSSEGIVESLMTISEDVTDRIRSEQELSTLTNRLFNLQDEERRRIARELHDGTAQNLFAISVNLAKLGQLSPEDKLDAKLLLAECQSLGDQSLQEIRTLSYVLHPPLLDEAGLNSAIRWFVEGFSRRSGIYVDVHAQAIDRLPSEVEMALFRIVQEALTNVHRHSGSDTATIRIDRKADDVVLEIVDQGKGLSFSSEDDNNEELFTGGVGIPGMRQRLRRLGGSLKICSNDTGTLITAIVPITKTLAAAGRGRSGD